MEVVHAENVTKTFREGRQEVPVLRGVTLSLAAGEVLALEGPSGSGKTTLISILGCILSATSGTVIVDGQTVDPKRPAKLVKLRRKSIGFVFQQYNLFPALSALDNVEYALNLKGTSGSKAREQAKQMLERVGLGSKLKAYPRDLSGGQKQRVAIARALVASPAVLLADEPTANLDSESGENTLQLMRELAGEGTRGVLIVTHDHKVRRYCDRVIEVRDGRLSS
jgi:putative ABC transport system ATP-binding protein